MLLGEFGANKKSDLESCEARLAAGMTEYMLTKARIPMIMQHR